MICFDVLVNGENLCRAGIGEYGGISAILTWVKCQPEEEIAPEQEWRTGEPYLSVGGMVDNEHISWVEQRQIKVGDEMVIRIIEAVVADPPVERHDSQDPEIARRNRYELYRIYKQEFETIDSDGKLVERPDGETARALKRSVYEELRRELGAE